MTDGGFQSHLHMLYGLPNGFISSVTPTQPVYDGDYVDKHFYGVAMKKALEKKKRKEALELPSARVIEKAPAIIEDESELMMIFAELFDD